MSKLHIPVLLDEVLAALHLARGQVVADCTVGLGGHSAAMLKKVGKTGKLIGLDLDPANLDEARVTLESVGANFSLHHANFAGLPGVLAGEPVDALLADLGIASTHVDDPARGFSYRKLGRLDMRMDPTRGKTAAELLNTISEAELAAALLELGDEEDAREIARLVVQRRPLKTTQDLAVVVCEARNFTMKRAAGAKLHPAARTFQALRILVNREMANLDRLLAVLPTCLKPGGIAAIISFHSGEDRRVKAAFRDGLASGIYDQISPDPVMARPEEREINKRSRSAKLRWARIKA